MQISTLMNGWELAIIALVVVMLLASPSGASAKKRYTLLSLAALIGLVFVLRSWF